MKLVVIDYESGNLRSVSRALESHGVSPLVTGDAAQLRDADALVLPGVGSGPAAMNALSQRGLVEPLREFAATGKPFLGVCLGLQLMLDWTEEGDAPCLGIVPGRVKLLPGGAANDKSSNGSNVLKIPHMGWNSVSLDSAHPALTGIPTGSYFYFVHSYYAQLEDASGMAGTTEYGVPFCSIYAKDNLVATQFHPEKSGPTGLRIYQNFVAMASQSQKTAQPTSNTA